MSFDKLLPHTCEITLPGKENIGMDDWGRPIYKDKEPKEVSCRYMTRTVVTKTNVGLVEVNETSLLLQKTCEVDNEMTISNVKDTDGNLLTTKQLEVETIVRQTARKKLHHYKVLLRGVE